MSATLSPELNALKKVVLHSPAVLKLEEEDNALTKKRKEGNQRKETWTSHNTSSLARRFRIIDTTFSLCNIEL